MIIALAALGACAVVAIIRGGVREGYLEPAHEQAARQWEAVVWNNTRWLNGAESPEEGIARLSTPHLLGGKK